VASVACGRLLSKRRNRLSPATFSALETVKDHCKKVCKSKYEVYWVQIASNVALGSTGVDPRPELTPGQLEGRVEGHDLREILNRVRFGVSKKVLDPNRPDPRQLYSQRLWAPSTSRRSA